MDNFSNEPLPEKTVNWPYMIIAVLLVLLTIAGTVIYYQKQTTLAPDQTKQTAGDQQTAPAGDIKTDGQTATTTNSQIPDNGETQITTSSGGGVVTSTPENTSTEINLPKPGTINVPKQTIPGTLPGSIKITPVATEYVYLYNDYVTPRTLTVSVKTKVVWKNVQWVAHLLIDRAGDFNSAYSIDANEEYSYIFTAPGTHEYFDYYNRAVTGTIIVK